MKDHVMVEIAGEKTEPIIFAKYCHVECQTVFIVTH
jgi:hypothetical protein